MIGVAFSPESPRYYVSRGNATQARANLSKLRGLPQDDPEIEAEMAEMLRKDAEDKSRGDASYLDCFKGEGRMALRTTIGA